MEICAHQHKWNYRKTITDNKLEPLNDPDSDQTACDQRRSHLWKTKPYKTATVQVSHTNIADTQNWMEDFTLSVNKDVPSVIGYLLFVIWISGIITMLIFVIRSALSLFPYHLLNSQASCSPPKAKHKQNLFYFLFPWSIPPSFILSIVSCPSPFPSPDSAFLNLFDLYKYYICKN